MNCKAPSTVPSTWQVLIYLPCPSHPPTSIFNSIRVLKTSSLSQKPSKGETPNSRRNGQFVSLSFHITYRKCLVTVWIFNFPLKFKEHRLCRALGFAGRTTHGHELPSQDLAVEPQRQLGPALGLRAEASQSWEGECRRTTDPSSPCLWEWVFGALRIVTNSWPVS